MLRESPRVEGGERGAESAFDGGAVHTGVPYQQKAAGAPGTETRCAPSVPALLMHAEESKRRMLGDQVAREGTRVT